MDLNYLSCQVCFATFKGVRGYKRHVRSTEHRKKMEEVFQNDKFKNNGFFPSIVLMDPVVKHDIKLLIVGLSQLTLCFSIGTNDFFYLCHVCEEKCSPERIASHFSSGDHCSNYFSYTNPNAVSFSWIPSMAIKATLRPELIKEVKETGSGHLQMLELPENLLKKLETSTYSEVMHTLSENAKLLKLLKAFQPERKMIQTYQSDSNRKHPLLGMQHLIECICDGPTEKRHYLCTLCNLTLGTHMIIKHVLSFDHIYCYFREWHPSTLNSKECYLNYSKRFADMMLDLAKKAEKNTYMKQVSLEPQQFTSVNFNCYAEALKDLESITKDRNGSSLITIIKPGKKLESHLGGKDPSCGSSLKLRCQDCNITFDTFLWFKKHLSTKKHKEMLVKFFSRDEGADGYDQKEHLPYLTLYRYIDENVSQNRPVVGVPLVVTCVCTQYLVEPLYVCFACEECFYQPSLGQHFNSRKHLIRTLWYQNPWRLPFAWDCCPDVKVLKSLAWQEERERGPNHAVLKIFDIPYWMFWGLTPVYQHVMQKLKLQHALLKSEVPRCETYTKLKEGERFPLLGQQFLVQYEVSVNEQQPSSEMAFLCLLCEKKLLEDESHVHVISREHVEKFLNRFHPGSLNSSTDAETLLDLAKQAAAIHSISHVQVMDLDMPIWEPCTYIKTKYILAAAKRRQGKGSLEPQITPKRKLVSREKDSKRSNQMLEKSEKKSGQSSTENSETTLNKISVDAGAEITKPPCGEKGEKGANKETPTPNENKMEKMREVVSKTSSEEINTASSETSKAIKEEKMEVPTVETCQVIKEEKMEVPTVETCQVIKEEKMEVPTVETCQVIKEEKMEEPIVRKPSGEIPESGQITDSADGKEIGEEGSEGVLTELKNNMHKENERKRTRSMSEKKKNTRPDEEVKKEMGHKRQRLTSKQDPSGQELQNPTDEGESGKPSIKTTKHEVSSDVNDQQTMRLWQYLKRKTREPVVGLDALLECCCDKRDPIYLCECCSLKIPEIDIISHVTGADHQKRYLMGSKRLSPPPVKLNIRHLAAVFEQENGYGEAQVIDLDEDSYINIFQQSFKSATQTVKALKAQQDSEFHPASALTAVEPMDTSLTDDFQVVDMDVDEDTSSLHASTTGTNTSCLLPDARAKDTKAEIISNANGVQLKTTATSKIMGASQNAAASDSALTNSTKSVTTISKCPAKTSSSTSHTISLTAPISNLGATTSSCATTNSTTFISRETVQKCVAATSSATVTTPKQTADNLNSSITSKIENGTKKSGTSSKIMAASQTVVTSSDMPKMTKTSLKFGNAEAFAKTECMKNSIRPNSDVGPDAPKNKTPAAPHQKTLMSQHKNPPREASHTSTSKTKPSEGLPAVGKNYTVAVTCKDRKQIYCKVCSVRMKQSAHLYNQEHQYNYVKMKYPWWNAKPNEQNKLDKIVAHLAEAEKNLGFRFQQKIEVSMKVYKELADLPDHIAMQRLKELLRQRSSRVTSSSTTASNEEVLGQQVPFASPCEVSSPDDGMPQNEIAGLSPDIQSEQEKKHEHQTSIVQIPEIESISNEDGNLTAIQADRTRSLKRSEPEANNPISPQLHSCPPLNKNKPEAIAAPSSQLADITVHVKQETFECEVSQAEITPAVELPAVKMEEPHPVTAHSFTQTHNTYQEMAEKGPKQERSDPDFQDTHEVPKDPQKTSPVKLFNPDPLPSAAAVNTEQQNQSRPVQKVEHVQKPSGCSPEPGKPSTSQAYPTISIGKRIRTEYSHLPKYLSVSGLAGEPIIGWRSVWECQGVLLKTFYLCESCSEMIPSSNICRHMVSEDHQINCTMKWHSKHMWFMSRKDVAHYWKMEIVKNITRLLSTRESEKDVQVVMLRDEWYEYVRKAPFSEALEMMKKVEPEPTSVFLRPSAVLQKDQQPEDWQSRAQSPPTERRSTHALEPDQRDDNDARLKTDKHHLEKTVVAGVLDPVKQIRAASPLDVTRASPKVESVVPLLPDAGTCHSLQESCRSPFMQPELRPLISQHQKVFPDLQVKQEEVHSESLSSSLVSHKTSLTQLVSSRDTCLPDRKQSADTSSETLVRPDTSNPQFEDPLPAKVQSASPTSSVLVSHKTSQTWSVSPRDVCLPGRKSPADTSPETLVRLGINNPQLEDLLLAKCTRSSPQPISQASTESAAQSPPVNPAATSTHKDTGSGSEEEVNYKDLADLLREMKSDTGKQSSMERRLDSKYAQTTCQMDKKQTRWDSKWQPLRGTVKQQSFFTGSLEDTFSTVAPVISGCENQLVTLNASFSATDPSLEVRSAGCNLLSRATEAKAVDTVLPSVSTSSQSDPQHQRDVTSHNPGLISPPHSQTDTNSTGGCQLPISPIITTRPEPPKKKFKGSHMGQEQTEVNTGKPVSHSSPTVDTASPSEVPLAASGYGQYSQMAYATNGHSGYLCSEATAHCITAGNPPEGYAAWGFSPFPFYSEQEPNHFGHSLATPPQMELQQQLMDQQQQQHLMQQQQLIQQQHLSWASVLANNSQSYMNINYQRITPVQNSNNMMSHVNMSHNPLQGYLNPPDAHYRPTPQSEIHYLFSDAQSFFK